MERLDLLARVGDERDVDRAARMGLAVRDDEIRELRSSFALPERRDAQGRERSLVERDARLCVTDTDVDMVDDDPSSVPVDAHGSNPRAPTCKVTVGDRR